MSKTSFERIIIKKNRKEISTSFVRENISFNSLEPNIPVDHSKFATTTLQHTYTQKEKKKNPKKLKEKEKFNHSLLTYQLSLLFTQHHLKKVSIITTHTPSLQVSQPLLALQRQSAVLLAVHTQIKLTAAKRKAYA